MAVTTIAGLYLFVICTVQITVSGVDNTQLLVRNIHNSRIIEDETLMIRIVIP